MTTKTTRSAKVPESARRAVDKVADLADELSEAVGWNEPAKTLNALTKRLKAAVAKLPDTYTDA